MEISVALGQALSRPADLDGNLALAWRWGREAAGRGAQVLVLPELFDWGYDLKSVGAKGPSPLSLELGKVAAATGLTVVSGLALSEGFKPRNASVAFAPDGGRQTYSKVHLFEAEPNVESRVFTAGDETARWRIAGAQSSALICYDLRFPELARAAALGGAEVIYVSSAWPASRTEVFRVLCQSRAIENQVFVVSANLCGKSDSGHFAGHSMVVAPDGSILAEAGEGEALLFARLDLGLVEKNRAFLPCFRQRRPGVYGGLLG